MFSRFVALLALSAIFAPLATAHSWIEEYQVISSNGSFVGDRGYSRGFVGRGDPTFNGFADEWMLPSLDARNNDGTARTRINSSDLLCHPAQRVSNYTSTYPKLKVQPGDYVAMKYLENGHVTLPWNITGKPAGGGPVYVFGTTQPADDEKLANVMSWTHDGTGGDGRGFLMTAQNFDDGRCHQLNCGNISQQRQILYPNHVAGQPTSTVESWCETDLKIPENSTAGTLTVYWVWSFSTQPSMDCNQPYGKDEYYTTCADFDVVDAGTSNKIFDAPFSAAVGENPGSRAVESYKSRTAYVPTPSVIMQENNKYVGSLLVNSNFVSSCTAQVSVIAANSLAIWPEVYVPNTCSVVSTFGSAAASSAAAQFASAASSYTSARAVVYSSAFAAAKVVLPTNTAWSSPVTTAPASASASAYQSSAPMITFATSSASAPALYGSTFAAQSEIIDVMTITTVVVITETVTPGQTSSASASASSVYSFSAVTSAPSFSTSASPNSYGITTVKTVGGNGSAPARRDHPRRFR